MKAASTTDTSRIVSFDLMPNEPDYYYVLTEALREFAASQYASADFSDDGEARVRLARTAEAALDRIEDAMNSGGEER